MIDNKNKNYKISIGGTIYSVITDEPESHVLRAAELVDILMQEALQGSGNKEQAKVAVLVALRLASKVVALEATMQQYTLAHNVIAKSLDQLME
jgi:cell division protein ZapA (FtsZ GTPase activity inhibitor)